MFCWKCHCGRDGNFCQVCGAKLLDESKEVNCFCGKKISLYDYYCPNCGRQHFLDAIIDIFTKDNELEAK